MAAETIDMWIKFFRDAGIDNSNATALYASTFAENEIQENMVGDLTRDILREIGITVMGHVLAILKHSKVVHSRAENEKIVAKTSKTSKPYSSETTNLGTAHMDTIPLKAAHMDSIPQRKSSPSRIIEHYVRPASQFIEQPQVKFVQDWSPTPIKVELAPKPKVTDRLGIKKRPRATQLQSSVVTLQHTAVKTSLQHTAAKNSLQHTVAKTPIRLRPEQASNETKTTTGLRITDRLGIKKRPRVSVTHDSTASAMAGGGGRKRISVVDTQKLVEDVPVKRNRRVLPEQEGSYKITMPSGSTPLTRKLLARQGRFAASSRPKTVFERLGTDGSVSSTTDVEVATSSKAGGSVFSRLGTASAADDDEDDEEPIEYAGILKKEPIASFTRTFIVTPPSAAKVNKTAGILANPTNAKQASAKSRLGLSTLKAGAPGTVIKRKRVMLVKRSGEREIVYRDMVVMEDAEQTAAPFNTLDPETRSKFRSDNIVAGRSSLQQEPGEEWDY